MRRSARDYHTAPDRCCTARHPDWSDPAHSVLDIHAMGVRVAAGSCAHSPDGLPDILVSRNHNSTRATHRRARGGTRQHCAAGWGASRWTGSTRRDPGAGTAASTKTEEVGGGGGGATAIVC